jgi:hypothetical protein
LRPALFFFSFTRRRRRSPRQPRRPSSFFFGGGAGRALADAMPTPACIYLLRLSPFPTRTPQKNINKNKKLKKQILEMLPSPDANLSTLFAVTDAAYAAIDSDITMVAFKNGNASGADLASLEGRLPLAKAASMWLFRSLQRPYSLDDLRGLTYVPTALAAATQETRFRLYFTPIDLRGAVRSVVIDDLLSAYGREMGREE